MNVANLKRVMRRIQREPKERLCMAGYHCGSAHCIAGWAQIISGKKPLWNYAARDARRFLGISEYKGDLLFNQPLWPEPFRKNYSRDKKRTTLARIRHFLKTKGRE